jgi:hypothetical protein
MTRDFRSWSIFNEHISAKAQPIVFSNNVYVAGNGVLYMIDMLDYRVIQTIEAPTGMNITSLATVGRLLLIGEGGGSAFSFFRRRFHHAAD